MGKKEGRNFFLNDSELIHKCWSMNPFIFILRLYSIFFSNLLDVLIIDLQLVSRGK